nr:MAG TPA: hypothetical protein [Caudoviricetes sp.]
MPFVYLEDIPYLCSTRLRQKGNRHGDLQVQ